LGGTNGEGPSLGAVQKRDLVRQAVPLAGRLRVIAGLATSSLEEAIWLAQQAGKAGAVAVLALPPAYFREAPPAGIAAWFSALLHASPVPVIVYHLPQRTGVPLTEAILTPLLGHPNFLGLKDSSGERANLALYRALLPGGSLFVGDETLLLEALAEGWGGTISGAANSVPAPLVKLVRSRSSVKFELLLPVLQGLRRLPQPMAHKAVLHRLGVLTSPRCALPLGDLDAERAENAWRLLTESALGDLTRF
jgi:dihydrodipicolinate synthase/N-acetylneuraminate lyase